MQARVKKEMEKQMNSDDRTIKYNKEYLNSLTKSEQLGYSQEHTSRISGKFVMSKQKKRLMLLEK